MQPSHRTALLRFGALTLSRTIVLALSLVSAAVPQPVHAGAAQDHWMKDVLLTLADPDVPRPPTTLKGASPATCLAVALYHEARNQTVAGQLAVASVILQRAAEKVRWGSTPCTVVRAGAFSFMHKDRSFAPIREAEAWRIAVVLADLALVAGPFDLLRGADHYHTRSVHPSWRHDMVKVAVIGDHIFYRDPARSRS